jgi:hypothetical protein
MVERLLSFSTITITITITTFTTTFTTFTTITITTTTTTAAAAAAAATMSPQLKMTSLPLLYSIIHTNITMETFNKMINHSMMHVLLT